MLGVWLLGFAAVFARAAELRPTPAPAQDPTFQLPLVLKSAREYCCRLERAAMDFVCLEEVSETVDPSRDERSTDQLSNIIAMGEARLEGHLGKPLPFNRQGKLERDNDYLFDYQFVRQQGKVTERRLLLEKNGKKVRGGKEPPKTETFQYSDILLAPVRLLDDANAQFYRYRLLREDAVDGVKVWLLEVAPRMAIADVYLGAVIWLAQDDARVLRIDWDPATFGNYENILTRAKKYGLEPRVTSRTEFSTEKNGLRFPSLDLTEEAYIGKDGKKFVRATTRVAYGNYKFFVVETETGVAK